MKSLKAFLVRQSISGRESIYSIQCSKKAATNDITKARYGGDKYVEAGEVFKIPLSDNYMWIEEVV